MLLDESGAVGEVDDGLKEETRSAHEDASRLAGQNTMVRPLGRATSHGRSVAAADKSGRSCR